MSDEADRKHLTDLIRRFNTLGCALPNEGDIRAENNEQTIASAHVLLAEMNKTKAEIDRMLGIPHSPLVPTPIRRTDFQTGESHPCLN